MEETRICIIKKSDLDKWYEKEREIAEFMKWQVEENTEDEWIEF